jgi:hypothetical protein
MALDAFSPPPEVIDVDENGVDRTQIRALLALSPEERLRYLSEHLASLLELRALNENLPPR